MKVIAKKLKTAPVAEPVSVSDVKNYIKLDVDETLEDALITTLIKAARAEVEKYTGRALITQTWYCYPSAFPTSDEEPIELPNPPLSSVTSIIYYDTSDVATTLAAAQYYTDTASQSRGRIFMKDSYSWPTDNLRRSMPIIIEYICGYGAATAVPQALVTAVLQLVTHWYENREPIVAGSFNEIPDTIKYCLNPYTLIRM